jgi:hypothetical protein
MIEMFTDGVTRLFVGIPTTAPNDALPENPAMFFHERPVLREFSAAT